MNKLVVKLFVLWMVLAIVSPAMAESEASRMQDKRGTISGPIGENLYSKPVWRNTGRGTYVGGYMDFEYRNSQNRTQKFEVIRVVPFIYADIAPGIRFATEIEFEHGGATSGGNGDAKLEFAVLDYDVLEELLTFRGGIILAPLGKFNLAHDSPVNDLNERPLVSRVVIPSTFFEPGAGFYGTAYPGDSTKLNYEIYITQGFNGGATGLGDITSTSGLRGARSNVNGTGDNNEKVAFAGRLAVSPILGTEIGGSFHTGDWDDKGKNNLTVLAIDWGFKWRNLEFLGEYANAYIARDQFTDPTVPGRLEGVYGQLNVHFLSDVVRPGSVFTGVVRVGHVDLDLLNQTSAETANDLGRVTFGINYRPIERTVFKCEYQINYEDWARTRVSNDAWILGLATYF